MTHDARSPIAPATKIDHNGCNRSPQQQDDATGSSDDPYSHQTGATSATSNSRGANETY